MMVWTFIRWARIDKLVMGTQGMHQISAGAGKAFQARVHANPGGTAGKAPRLLIALLFGGHMFPPMTLGKSIPIQTITLLSRREGNSEARPTG
jgi:hypothetical protein